MALPRLLPALRHHLSPSRFGRHLSQGFVQVLAESGSLMLLTFAVARVWGAELFGLLGVLLIGVHLLTMIADGMMTSQIRTIASREELEPGVGRRLAWQSTLCLAWVSLPFCALLIVALPWFMADTGRVGGGELLLVGLACWTRIVKGAAEAAHRALRQFSRPAIVGIVSGPVHLAATLTAVLLGGEILIYLALLVAVQSFGILALLIPLRVVGGSSVRGAMGEMLRYGMPLMFRGFVGFLYLKINIPLLECYASLVDVGNFRLAEQVLLIPTLLVGAVVSALAPRAAAFWAANKRASLVHLIGRTYAALFAIMVPATFLFWLNAPVVNRLFPGFESASIMIQLVGISLLPRALSMVCVAVLLVHGGRGGLATILSVVAGVANLGAVWWVLEQGGDGIAAVMAMVSVHIAVSVSSIVFTHWVLGLPFRLIFRGEASK